MSEHGRLLKANTVRRSAVPGGDDRGSLEGVSRNTNPENSPQSLSLDAEIEHRLQELATELAGPLADERVSARLHGALPALQGVIDEIRTQRDCWLADWETAAVRLSVAIAEKILHAELSRRPELADGMISQALQLAVGQPQLTVHLHPDDLSLLEELETGIEHRLAELGSATLVPDPQISRGGCRIETRQGTIDARLETQLQRIASELLGSPEV